MPSRSFQSFGWARLEFDVTRGWPDSSPDSSGLVSTHLSNTAVWSYTLNPRGWSAFHPQSLLLVRRTGSVGICRCRRCTTTRMMMRNIWAGA
eukprot:10767-Chlamydomonas_euryale.AAC.1